MATYNVIYNSTIKCSNMLYNIVLLHCYIPCIHDCPCYAPCGTAVAQQCLCVENVSTAMLYTMIYVPPLYHIYLIMYLSSICYIPCFMLHSIKKYYFIWYITCSIQYDLTLISFVGRY